MKLKLTILAALAAFTVLAAETPKPAPKADAATPRIETSRFWRLVAQAQLAHQQAIQTPQAKAADAADEDVKKEQAALEAKCGAGFMLGYQQDQKADNAGDVICIVRPAAPPAAATPEPPKGK